MAWYTSKSPSSSNPYLDNINPEKIKQAKENLKVEFNPTPEYADNLLNPPESIPLLSKFKPLDLFPNLSQSPTWQKIRVGDIKGLANELGIGLAHGLANTGTARNNAAFDQMLAQSKEPGTATYGQQQLANRQTQQNFLNANPVNSLPAMLGEQIPQIPLWMAGEAGLKALGKGIGKLAPSLTTKAETVGAKLPNFVKGGLLDTATYGSVVAPVESIRNGDNFNQFLERERQLPGVLLGGIAARGAFQGAGALKAKGQDFLKPLGVPEAPINPPKTYSVQRRSGLGSLRNNDVIPLQEGLNLSSAIRKADLQTNPIEDIQSAYQTPSIEEVLAKAKLEAQNARQAKKYTFTTGEQRAFQELQDGIEEAQNYARHTDVLAPYPPGTTVEQAYANIKANTGVDLPKLMDNWNKAQSAKTQLTPEEMRMGRLAGVIPNLKPRYEAPRQWTNREGIPTNATPTIKPITQEITPGLKGNELATTKGLPNDSVSIEIPVVNGRADIANAKTMTARTETPKQQPLRTMAADIETPSTPNTPTISIPLNSTPSTSSSSGPRIVSSFNKEKIPFSEKLQRIYRETVNNTQGIDRTVKGTRLTGADNPVVMTTNARNAGGTVDHIINKGLVDMSGKPVANGSVADAFKMPKEKQQAFDEYLYHLHNVDRMREGKPVFDGETSISESKKAIADLENAHPEFKEKASVVRKTLDELLNKWGVDSGLVAPELRDALQEMYKNYVPTYRSLEGASAIATKTRTAGAAKIINKAVGGEEPLITLRESIPMLINKTVKAARKNEVYKGILEATRANPQNGFAKILGEDVKASESLANSVRNDGLEGIAANSEKALEADPKLGYLLTVMEEGKPVKLQINKELFDSLQALNKVDDTSLHKALQTVKKYATNPFKALITGYNPFFALRNVARDIPTAYIQGTENNPFKFVGNLGTAAKDMVTKNPRYKEFQALGGQGSNFFNIEKGGIQTPGKLKKVGQKVGNVISSVNNFTETLPRYGEYVGTLKRGGEGYSNKMQGLHNAAEVTVNFGRHGDITKAVDALVPYLNPAIQGGDKFFRTMMKPINVAKAIGATTIPTGGFYALNQMIDKNGYDQVDNRTKDTYYLIPEGNGKFIKVAKTREAGVLFGTLFERIARTMEGQESSFKGFGNTVKTNFFPNNPLESNIVTPIINAKYTNKDFANREIVPSYMTDNSPRYQYDEKTSEIAKTIGDKLNLSPKQIDYLIKSYTGVVGSLLLPATTKGGATVGNVISRNFTADANYNNEIQNNFYDQMSELRRLANDKNISQNIPSKVVTNEEAKYNAMAKISKDMSAIRKEQLKAQQSGNQAKADLLQAQLLQMAKRATK